MDFRYRFTVGFALTGIAILAVAVIVTGQLARQNEESTLVDDIRAESAQSAELIAGVAGTYAAGEGLAGAPADSAASLGFESLIMSTLMQSSNIVRLSLYDDAGTLLWSSQADATGLASPTDSAFAESLGGTVSTELNKNVSYVNDDGQGVVGDVTSTYIPLVNSASSGQAQILEISREVTDTLDFRVDNARDAMLRTLYGTLGAAFAVLLGIVLSADTIINRSRRKAFDREREAAESKVEAERLELRNQHLQQLDEERNKFLSMVSHELRTPLTSMLAFTDIVGKHQEGESADKNLQHLARVRRSGSHLESLIAELLDVTRLHAASFEIIKEPFLVGDLIDDVVQPAAVVMKPRNQTLVVDSEVDELEVVGDRKRMMQLAMNLVSNASAYSPTDTTIKLQLRANGNLLRMEVTDEGPGIAREDQQHLFDQFYRCDNNVTRAHSGLGLGLSIVKAIVEGHNGRVSLISNPGYGTTVTVQVPIKGNVGSVTSPATAPQPGFDSGALPNAA